MVICCVCKIAKETYSLINNKPTCSNECRDIYIEWQERARALYKSLNEKHYKCSQCERDIVLNIVHDTSLSFVFCSSECATTYLNVYFKID